MQHLRTFFAEVVPSEVQDTGNDSVLSAVVFVDYVPIHFTAAVVNNSPSLLTMAPGKHFDAVKFRGLCSSMLRFLDSSGAAVLVDESRLLATPAMDTDLDADFDADFEDEVSDEDWHGRIEAALEDLCSARASLREEAAQALWRWADTRPNCRAAMAKAFEDGSGVVQASALSQDAAVHYPIAAARRLALAGLLQLEGADLQAGSAAKCAEPASAASTWSGRSEASEEIDIEGECRDIVFATAP